MKKIIYRIWAWLHFQLELMRKNRAVREAKRMHMLTGKRYWVIKLKGKYWVYSNNDVKYMKRMKIFKKELDFIKLQEVCVFKTK